MYPSNSQRQAGPRLKQELYFDQRVFYLLYIVAKGYDILCFVGRYK